MNQTEALIAAFLAVWLFEFYLFGMQRASLLIARTSNMDWKSVGVHLLPTWYPVTWLVRIAKWGLLVAIFIFAGWKLGLVCLVAGFVLSAVIPIPYRMLYSGVFKRSVQRISKQDSEAGDLYRSMLHNSDFPT